MTRDFVVVGEIAFNGLSQSFAQLNSPLIERVDVPDDSLCEDLVLVGGDEGAESEWRQLLDHERVSRAVSGEDLMRNEILQLVAFHAGLLQLRAHLLFGLTESERFCLGEEVGEQQLVVDSSGDWVVSLS